MARQHNAHPDAALPRCVQTCTRAMRALIAAREFIADCSSYLAPHAAVSRSRAASHPIARRSSACTRRPSRCRPTFLCVHLRAQAPRGLQYAPFTHTLPLHRAQAIQTSGLLADVNTYLAAEEARGLPLDLRGDFLEWFVTGPFFVSIELPYDVIAPISEDYLTTHIVCIHHESHAEPAGEWECISLYHFDYSPEREQPYCHYIMGSFINGVV